MIDRLLKFFSYRMYPPIDLRDGQGVLIVKNKDNKQAILQIEKPFRSGFYMLEYCFHPSVTGGCVQFSMLNSTTDLPVVLPLYPTRLNKRIVHIGADVKGCELRVLDSNGQFLSFSQQNCEYLRFVPLRTDFATSRMLRRLQVTAIAVRWQAKKYKLSYVNYLYDCYDHSFTQSADGRYQNWIDHVEVERQIAARSTLLKTVDEGHHFFCAPGYHVSAESRALLMAALNANSNVQLVYGDDDQWDVAGARKKPRFKPDWNPDLFLAQDYISNFYACRQEWYEKHETIFEHLGARLALSQLLPTMDAKAVLRLPQVLAHRIESASGDDSGEGALDLTQRRITVLQEILPGEVTLEPGQLSGSIRIRYPLPDPAPLASLLVPTRDGLSVLQPCVESILDKTRYPNYEILILDNQSEKPETLSWLAEIGKDDRVRVLPYNKPFNYSAINNFGARHAKGSVIGLINNDVEVISPDWLIEMVSQAMRPEIGCVGAKLYYSNGHIQHGGVILGLGDVAGHAHRFLEGDDEGYHGRLKLVQNYSAVTAACLLVRREIYDGLGGLEEKHLTVAYNDVDFCIRVREAGYRNLWTPHAELYHHESISRGEDDTPTKKARYQKEVAYMHKTWGEQLANDPCYNPNLCRRREDFSLPDVLF